MTHRIAREQIVSQIRNPVYSWSQRVRFLNYGESSLLSPEDAQPASAVMIRPRYGQ